LQTGIKVAPQLLDEYAGVYRLTADTSRTITMVRENDQLIAKVSATTMIPVLFQSDTKFQFKNLLNADCEFIKENGKVIKFNVSQNGHYEWIRLP